MTVIVFIDVDLGASDCDTCGTNFESLEATFDDGMYAFRLSVGCYSGSQFFSDDRDEFLIQVIGEREYFGRIYPELFDDFDAMIAAVAAHVPAPTTKDDDRD